jgi:mono/diheme cytochrome c family protein
MGMSQPCSSAAMGWSPSASQHHPRWRQGATPMPPWGEVFSPEEIWEIVAYLKSIGKW